MSSIGCMTNHFRKWRRSPRIWMIFFIMLTFCAPYFTDSIRQFCQQYNASCTVWLFPLAMTSMNRRLWIMLLPILLFCDAPFLDDQQPFVIVRTGRIRWGIGQLFYVFVASAVFCLICFLAMAAMLFPHIEFTLQWGKVIRTLSQEFAAQLAAMDSLPSEVINQYTPLQALFLCGMGTWIATSFLGLLMFLCNLWARREFGIILAGCFVGLSHFVEIMGLGNQRWYSARYLSPVSWMNILDIGRGTEQSPSWRYVCMSGVILLVILSGGILLSVRHKSIDIIKPV